MGDDSVATSDKNVSFSLSGTTTGFDARSASVFSALNKPVDKSNCKSHKVNTNSVDVCLMPPPHPDRKPQKEKFPDKTHERSRRQPREYKSPDHVLHPERWQKYSLEDTELSSDGQNKQAAFAFLAELRNRKSHREQHPEMTDYSPKFKKPKRKEQSDRDVRNEMEGVERSSQSAPSGKLVLREYVVGSRRPKPRVVVKSLKSERSVKSERSAKVETLTLSHLEDEDEDEVEDEEDSQDACDRDSRETDVDKSDEKT